MQKILKPTKTGLMKSNEQLNDYVRQLHILDFVWPCNSTPPHTTVNLG